jgi:hypothetical protein
MAAILEFEAVLQRFFDWGSKYFSTMRSDRTKVEQPRSLTAGTRPLLFILNVVVACEHPLSRGKWLATNARVDVIKDLQSVDIRHTINGDRITNGEDLAIRVCK